MFKLWREDKIELSYIFITMLLPYFWFSRGYTFRILIKYLGDYIFKKKINLS